PLTPTGLGGAKALPGDSGGDEDAALLRGRRLHLLLEHLPVLPEAGRAAAAADLFAADGDAPADHAEVAQLLAEAEAVLAAPELAPLWAADALAEVEITAEIGERRLIGTIDRLIVTADRVLAVDWKSNAVVPARAEDVPEGLLRQMGAYAHALAAIWPDRRIEVALLWTRTARLMQLPGPLVAAALARGLSEAGIDPRAGRP
ncbi:PD-(D/E)XK nuclease family protein, partial [Rhodobaculum claviforme]